MELVELDLRGLICPLPVLKAQKRLRALKAGQRVLVLTTDPKAPADFAHFCEASGHRLLESSQEGDVFRLLIECAG